MGTVTSRRICSPDSSMSTSRVSVTEPARLFSMGTTPSSVISERTASATAGMERKGMRWASGAYCRAASSENVPGGPR